MNSTDNIRPRGIARFIGRGALFTFGAIFICELFFRLVLPACNFPYAYTDPVTNILRYDEKRLTEGVYTIGRYAQQRGKWRVNNYGWISAVDYQRKELRDKPLVAVIGDSYLEAFHVDVDKSVAALLRDSLHGEYDVYQFGISGASLATYLQITRWVDSEFEPDIIVYLVDDDDLEQSMTL